MFHIADLLFFVATTFVSGTHVSIPMFTPKGTLEAIERHRPTHVLLVPVMILMMMDSEKLKESDVSSVELIAYGASPITEAALQKAFEEIPRCQILTSLWSNQTIPSHHDP